MPKKEDFICPKCGRREEALVTILEAWCPHDGHLVRMKPESKVPARREALDAIERGEEK